ncbi:hypothetical protein EMIHUDRAFT_226983 [Emiliania huxleyi CCMP1516]|uniref:Uncharacterized protein n=2 Tax=Emiliania huxleyi TaxID=2903 RepID=A0A0D3KK08_EMIH1|nr:hypothetical protein EMIHUDRAFT_226983 [Emiliania huxleyi CCMP1516]EOD36093.1 hypothetical protein EMIHUDRAFT_226983 [Emiliania huxleyi CCMP1516]|eukprot:XP_005788522.1 hypothetical protein EMIHUDRAFT_226983 [Emiliania huxleyi CCMP1516]
MGVCVDRTSDWRAAVRAQRQRIGQSTPSDELLRRPRPARDAFCAGALEAHSRIGEMVRRLRASHAAYVLDDGLNGLTEAERDALDGEGERVLGSSREAIERLAKSLAKSVGGGASAREADSGDAVAGEAVETRGGERGGQPQQHRKAMLDSLNDELRELGRRLLRDAQRASRLKRAMEALEGRLSADIKPPAHQFSEAGNRSGLPPEEWRGADASMLEVSSLSHMFASKIEQQSHQSTSENLTLGNRYIDSAAKHSRDFRLLVLTFLLVASLSLIFLDWYYP